MPEFDRWDILAAYNVYSQLYGWDHYTHGIQARLSRLHYHSPAEQTVEQLSANGKLIFGRLVRKHQAKDVAYTRLNKRRPDVFPSWPGTYNLPTVDPYGNWLKRIGIDARALDVWS